MKKFALMLAALSLCACTFSACGDDDDSASKAKKGESCASVDCEEGLTCNADSKVCEESSTEVTKAKKGESCEKAECDNGLYCNTDKICADMLKEGEACDDNTVCLDGLLCNDDKKCAYAKLGESCDLADCESGLDCDDTTKKCVEPAKAQAGDNCETRECDTGLTCNDTTKVCEKEASTGECYTSADCKDPEKPVCGEGYVCVAASSDLCDGKCGDGTECILGVCVSEAMKALKDGDAYPTDIAESFCNGDMMTYGGSDNKAHVMNCKENGYTGCVVFKDKYDEVQADCNGQQAALDACKADEKAGMSLDMWHIDTCLTSTERYEVMCTKDLSGNEIAVPTYEGENDSDSDSCIACTIEDGAPVCSGDKEE